MNQSQHNHQTSALPINLNRSEQLLKNSHQFLLLCTGHLLLGLGFVGLLLPVMPTTVFWIGAAMCYAKSSPKRYRQLVGRGNIGLAIQQYLDNGIISRSGKWASVFGMMMSALLLIWLSPSFTIMAISISGLLMAAVYVISRPEQVESPG